MHLIIFAFLTFFVFNGMAAAADGPVIIASSSSDEDLQPGVQVLSGKAVKLALGDSITLISKSGSIIKLRGPYSGPLTNSNTDGADANSDQRASAFAKIAKLVARTPRKTEILGASRKVKASSGDETGIWLMAVDSSGHRCVRPSDVVMWRKQPRSEIEITLRSETAKRTGILWAEGKEDMKLPSEFIEDGVLIVMKMDKHPRRFNLHVLPEHIDEKHLGKVLLWMAENDCSRQSNLLISAVHEEVE
ncbi:MAG: hypothetical protein GY761_20075 [Hyphomicrobiales bacterium]|nr:hypothetical protein [Hyphomicrobiales bacterium]